MHVAAGEDKLVRVLKPAYVRLWNHYGTVFIVHLEMLVQMNEIVVYSNHVWFFLRAAEQTVIRTYFLKV